MAKKGETSDKSLIEQLVKINILIEKKLTELAIDLKKIVTTFEEASKEIKEGKEIDTKQILDQLDLISKQNRAVANTLIIFERFLRHEVTPTPMPRPIRPAPRPSLFPPRAQPLTPPPSTEYRPLPSSASLTLPPETSLEKRTKPKPLPRKPF